MPDTNVGYHTSAFGFAVFLGSHLPRADWDTIYRFKQAGLNKAVYLLFPDSPHQYEDIRRLRHEAGVEDLLLRVVHGRGRLPSVNEYLHGWQPASVISEVRHALGQGFRRVYLQLVNEPDIELTDMTPAALDEWLLAAYAEVRAQLPDARLQLTGTPVSPFHPRAWAFWDGTRRSFNLADVACLHLAPKTMEELTGGWSLDWWLGQVPADKRLVIAEVGVQTEAPVETRPAILERLLRSLRDCARVDLQAQFIMSAEGPEHAVHVYGPADITRLITVASEATGTPTPAPAPVPAPLPTPVPTPAPLPVLPARLYLTLNGVRVPFPVTGQEFSP